MPIIVRQILLLTLLTLSFSSALAERLPIRNYTSADGLGSSFVDYVMRDSRGFMWFCTRDGLSRFDGSRFVTYRIGDQDGPPGIESITETRNGVYWIVTTVGLYRLNGNELTQFEKDRSSPIFLKTDFIDPRRGVIMEDRQGNIWFGDDDLYRLNESNGRLEFQQFHLQIPASANGPGRIIGLREAPDSSFWIYTNGGSLIRRLPDGRIVFYDHANEIGTTYTSTLIDKTGRVWVIWGFDCFIINPPPLDALKNLGPTTHQNLSVTSISQLGLDREVRLPDGPGEVFRFKSHSKDQRFRALHQTADGHIWILRTDDLLEFDGRAFHAYTSAQGLPVGMLRFAEDTAGNLWIGGHSLSRLDRKGLCYFGVADGLNSASVAAIVESPDGRITFANGDFYLSEFDGRRFVSTRPAIDSGAQADWSSRYAYLTRDNEWWVLTTTKLYRFAAANLRTPIATYDHRDGLSPARMYQIFEDSRGDIWLGQRSPYRENSGLARLRRGEKKFQAFSAAEGFPAGKAGSAFAEDQSGNLWIGFYEGGLARFANNRFVVFTGQDGVPSGLITDLLLDRQGRLWLSSANGGVSRIDDPRADRPVFKTITTADGLASNNVRTITEDNFGQIYAGTARGIDRISPDTGLIKHYSVNDGLAADFVVDSHRDRNGTLWFATSNGLSKLVPQNEPGKVAPTILLGGWRVAGVPQAASVLGNLVLGSLELSPTQNDLQIDFFGMDFRPGEVLRYQWMLEGADDDWGPATEQQTVTYANLNPGSYRFLVRAVNSDGMVSSVPAVLSFRILPPFWQRWWFITLAVLFVIGVAVAIERYRAANVRERLKAAEALRRSREESLRELESVRRRIASDLHDDIGSSLTQISLLSEVVRHRVDHSDTAIQRPLVTIANTSRDLVDAMSDIVWAINPMKDHLSDLSRRMRSLASEVMTAARIEISFHEPAANGDISLAANLRREVFLIFKEGINNVIKHSAATKVRIDFELQHNQLLLRIHDNGTGFDLEDDGDGHGISSMRARSKHIGARLDFTSRAGEGTTMTLQVPVNEPTGNGHG